jgi:hypothetical protein
MAEEKEILLRVELDRSEAQKGLEDTTRQLIENKAAISDLNKAYKEGSISTDEFVREQIKLKREQSDLTTKQREYNKQLSTEANSLDALRLKLAALTKERNSQNQGTREGAKRAKELTEEIKKTSEAIKEQEQAGGDFRRNVGNYGEAFQEAAGKVEVFGASMDGVFKLLLGNPILAIVAALFTLGKALLQNDTIATGFRGVMKGLGIILDNVAAFVAKGALGFKDFLNSTSETSMFVKDVAIRIFNAFIANFKLLVDLIPALGAALEGDFSKAMDIAGAATDSYVTSITFANDELPEFVKNLASAVDEGIKYEQALDAIEAKQSKLNVTIAELENQRDRLILQSKDLSRTEEDRLKLNEQAVGIDRKILKERLALLDEEIKTRTAYFNALGEDSTAREEVEFQLNELQVQRLKFQNESLRFEELAQNKRNALIEKDLAAKQKAAEEEQKLRKKQEEENQKIIDRSIAAENKKGELLLQNAIKNAKTIDEQIQRELDLEKFKTDAKLENENLLAAERTNILLEYEQKKAEIIKKGEELQREEEKKTFEEYRQVQQQKLSLAAGVFDAVSQLAKEGSDEQKVLASTAALINTFQGVTGALANSAPPPVGLGPFGSLLAAGTILIQGLAQVSNINAAAGGGDFVTTKPTLLLVGDNPGGRERVTVEPLSGKGQTKIFKDSGMIAMAGGGSLTAVGATMSRSLSSGITDSYSQSNTIIDALSSMPAPVVSVKETVKVQNRIKNKESIKNL